MWAQGYDPFGNAMVSTLIAAVRVVVLLSCRLHEPCSFLNLQKSAKS
jgi:hypothetical protein